MVNPAGATPPALLLDLGPHALTSADAMNSPLHAAVPSFGGASWNTVSAASGRKTGLVYANDDAADGVSVYVGRSSNNAWTSLTFAGAPASIGSGTNPAGLAGVFAASRSIGRDGLYATTASASGDPAPTRLVGVAVGGLAAGLYDVYVVGTNPLVAQAPGGARMGFWVTELSDVTATAVLDATSLTADAPHAVSENAASHVWVEGGNFAKLTVVVSSPESYLTLIAQGLSSAEQRGFLNSVQIVPVSNPVASVENIEVTISQDARFVNKSPVVTPKSWLSVRNVGPTGRAVRVEWIMQAPDGRVSRGEQAFNVPAQGEGRPPLPWGEMGVFGLYKVHYRVTVNGGTSAWASDVLAVYRKNEALAREQVAFPVGFATGAPRVTARMLELAASLGFSYHRFNAVWGSVQPVEGGWNWGDLDQHLALVESHGFRWQAMSSGSASWAAARQSDPPRLDAWRAWITALAERYRDRIEFWEVWNEPNISFFTGTVEEYGAVQREAFAAIKAVAPDVMVTSGGYAGMNHHASKPGAFEAALLDQAQSFDWFAYHMHDTFPRFYEDVHGKLANLQQVTGTKHVPLVFTETGFDTRHGERFQAETLVKKMTYASVRGAKRYTWYNLIDRSGRDEPNKPGVTFGLLTNPTGTGDFSSIENELRPKESFVAASVAIRELRSRAHRRTWAQDGRQFAFLFDPGPAAGGHLLVTWSEGGQSPGAIWVVESGAAAATQMDLFGNESPLPLVDGRALISLDRPRYHRFSGGPEASARPTLVGPLVTAPDQVIPGADGSVAVTLALTNPLSRVVTVDAIAHGAEFSAVLQPPPRTIAPGGEANFSFVLLPATPGKLGDIKTFDVTFSFDGLPWAPTLNIPVTFNEIEAAGGQQIVLREPHQVTNKQDYDPHSLHLLWGSPTDLSAHVTVTADVSVGTLRLRLSVTDNVHHVVSPSEPILDGDAVELGWATGAGVTARLEIAGEPGGAILQAGHLTDGRDISEAVQSATITREGTSTVYDLVLGLPGMGLSSTDTQEGILFNFAIHDNDGEGAKSWLSPLPGLGGEERFAPSEFPLLRLQ